MKIAILSLNPKLWCGFTFDSLRNIGFADDGVLAAGASLNDPENILVRGNGSVLLTDGDNGRVLIVGPDGRMRKFAGSGLSR
jgi:hypothetical protein